MQAALVLVIGGYGFFGRRLVERLSVEPGLQIVVAGRALSGALAVVDSLRRTARAALRGAEIDVDAADLGRRLKALSPQVVVHASGPFQGRGYEVARASLAAGAHCIDLADGREFVAGIGCLDAQARSAGLAVISGASSVPALSSAAADHLARGLVRVRSIDIGISPGNRTERGLSTVRSILSTCGQPLPARGAARSFGWSGVRRHRYGHPVGMRLLSPCDVPDLVLLPDRYPGRPAVSFGAGLELQLLHRGMNVMAMLSRLGIVRDWAVHASWLKWLADGVKRWGSDAGAMHVTVCGDTAEGACLSRSWQLLASAGDGPYVPTLAAAALLRRLRGGDAALIGARPCVGLLSLDEFAHEAAGLRIAMGETSP